MGSEHYCLRWNNHQSNLLGVFSQLLQDESLVDVTLACSEGAPIRAHKVVLSACSSYFQSLFLEHPERHPIVILKDVRFAELQTLVEFMYKGEVNVQYCQLSALLKTAESLKVKGLAEMTNQNTTLREPEREPDRVQPQSKTTCESPVDAAIAGPSTSSASSSPSSAENTGVTTNASATSSAITAPTAPTLVTTAHKRDATGDCCSSPPSKRVLTAAEQDSSLPLDLYQRRAELEGSSVTAGGNERGRMSATNTAGGSSNLSQQRNRCSTPGIILGGVNVSAPSSNPRNNFSEDRAQTECTEQPKSGSLHGDLETSGGGSDVGKIDDVYDDDEDDEMDLDDDVDDISSNEMGINMKIGCPGGLGSTVASVTVPSPLGGGVGDSESVRSTPPTIAACTDLPSDLTQRPLSHDSRDGCAVHDTASGLDRPSGSGLCGLPSVSSCSIGIGGGSTSSLLTGGLSPSTGGVVSGIGIGVGNLGSESLIGPSGLGPVQSVPLSLKKEIDFSEDDNSNSRHVLPRSASAGAGLGGGELDYRATHESETSKSPHGISGSGGGGHISAAPEQSQTPPPIYSCVYCRAAFPNQSKLTRHILSHSLKTLEFRETATHSLLHAPLLPHDLAPLPQQFAYQMNAAMAASGDPQEQAAAVAAAAAMDMDFAAVMAAANSCGLTGLQACVARGLDLDGSGAGGSGSSRGGGAGCSSSGNGGLGSGSSGSGLLLSGAGTSSSTSAAAAAAAASSSSALLGTSSSDPNSVVMCKFCGKSFPDVASLITHLPVHTGDRPFKCEFCGKAFKLRHHMKDHCRVHTGERPFRCQMCGKTFSRSTILKAHEKTHFPKYVRKFLSPSPVDTKDELPQ